MNRFRLRWVFVFVYFALLRPPQGRTAEESPGFAQWLRRTVECDALFLPPDHRVKVFSSYDRSGGDQDDTGFLRTEGDCMVIAEMEGPGVVTRIWSANPSGTLRLFLDQNETPLIECAFADVFKGKVEPFLRPFVRAAKESGGAQWSYAPLPFERSCKITLDRHCFYQIEYVALSPDASLRTLHLPLDKKDKAAVDEVGKRFQVGDEQPFSSSRKTEEIRFSHSLAAGDRIELASFAGPAAIRGVRLRWEGNRDDTGRELILRAYWDGEAAPSVESPAYDFFGGPVRTAAAGVEKGGWHYFYLPMPFHRRAALELEHTGLEGSVKIDAVFYLDADIALPESLRTFHASWSRDNETRVAEVRLLTTSQEPAAVVQENYQALSVLGSGHLAGLALFRTPSPESDASLYVDQVSEEPDVPDTGNDGFFDLTRLSPSVDWPLAAGARDVNGGDFLLRLFLPAPFEFLQGIWVSFEHGSGNALRQDYASVCYWYQEEPHAPFPPVLPLGLRRFRSAPLTQPLVVFRDQTTAVLLPFEAEMLAIRASGGLYETRDMMPYGPDWSGNEQLQWVASQEGDALALSLPAQEFSGYYTAECVLSQDPAGGLFRLALDEDLLFESVDLFASAPAPRTYRAPHPVFLHASDQPEWRLEARGKNAKSAGMAAGIDTLSLTSLPSCPERLQVTGPLALIRDATHSHPLQALTVDGGVLPLGFADTPDGPPVREWKPEEKTDRFRVASLTDPAHSRRSLFFVSWEVDIPESGIYRFETDPFDAAPFLLQGSNQTPGMEYRQILINGIVLRGEETVRYDPEHYRVLPIRFRVPLERGTNRISWMIYAAPDVSIQPRLYGILPPKSGNETKTIIRKGDRQ